MEKIELLSVDLLDRYREVVTQFEDLSRKVQRGIGWHYLLDLPWAVNELSSVMAMPSTVMDAGAGYGLVQWYLAQRGGGRDQRRYPVQI